MEVNLLKVLFAVIWFQLLFVSVFLFKSKRGKSISNRILATVFLMLSIANISLYWMVFGIQTEYPQLMFIDDTFMFAYGPLLYLFTQSVLFKKYTLNKKILIHFIPFFIMLCVIILYLLIIDVAVIAQTSENLKIQQVPLYFRIGEMLILTHILTYLYKSKRKIQKVRDKALETFSTVNQEEFKLVNFIINSFIILFLLAMIHSLLPLFGLNNSLTVTLLLIVLFTFYFINAVLFKMLKHTTNDSGIISQPIYEEKSKYAGSKLTKEQLSVHKAKLWNHMSSRKKFLESELNIDDLAIELDLSPKILSQIINEGYACNFFDFVNKFRIEEAKSLLSNPKDDKMTIQEVMYDVGFNSKSSFNTAFKKFTNLTPSQFRNNL